MYILFEGIGKSVPFNYILDCAIVSDFKMRNVKADKINLKCPQIAGNFSQSPKFSLALSMYSSDFRPKTEVNQK